MKRRIRLNGPLLRSHRKRLGHRSAETFAPLVGLSADQLYALETGRNRADQTTYQSLLDAFGLQDGDLQAPAGTCPMCGHTQEAPHAA